MGEAIHEVHGWNVIKTSTFGIYGADYIALETAQPVQNPWLRLANRCSNDPTDSPGCKSISEYCIWTNSNVIRGATQFSESQPSKQDHKGH